MRLARRLRYWLGARLLYPHVLRLWKEYDKMSGRANPHTDKERNNCAYISIGLRYAIGQRQRQESARHRNADPHNAKGKLATEDQA